MDSVGIRKLKANLSSYIDKAQRGEQIIITEHGKEVALIIPISNERKSIRALIDSGKAHWSGGKPRGINRIRIKGKALSKTVLEKRG